jgi:hypothetical protein
MQRKVAIIYRRFGTTYRSRVQWSVITWHLKMGSIGCPEMSVLNWKCSLRNNPEECSSGLNFHLIIKKFRYVDIYSVNVPVFGKYQYLEGTNVWNVPMLERYHNFEGTSVWKVPMLERYHSFEGTSVWKVPLSVCRQIRSQDAPHRRTSRPTAHRHRHHSSSPCTSSVSLSHVRFKHANNGCSFLSFSFCKWKWNVFDVLTLWMLFVRYFILFILPFFILSTFVIWLLATYCLTLRKVVLSA